MARVLLLHWGREAGQIREGLRARGHEVVLESRQAGNPWNAVRNEPYDVCVISLDEHPHLALNAAEATKTMRLKMLPLVLVGGDRKAVDRALADFPEASFTNWDELADVIDDVTPVEIPPPELRPY